MTGPAPFDLSSLDLGPVNTDGSGSVAVTVTGDIFGGGTESETFSGLTTSTTETLNWTSLQDITLSEGGVGDEFGVDNIIVSASAPTPSAVPEPGTMLLLGTGLLGTLTAAGRRSRKA